MSLFGSRKLFGVTGSGSTTMTGHPNDAIGNNGDTYHRTDDGRDWIYTKTAGVWKVTSAPLTAQVPDIFGDTGIRYYTSPYLANDTGGNIYGNLMTNNSSATDQNRIGLVHIGTQHPSAPPPAAGWYNGADGNSNLSVVTNPVAGGSRQMHRFRAQYNDAATAGGTPRTMVRYGDGYTTPAGGQGCEMFLNQEYVFAFTFHFTEADMRQYFTGGDLNNGVVLWQIHGNGQSEPTPNIAIMLVDDSYARSSSGNVYGTGAYTAPGAPTLMLSVIADPNTPPAANTSTAFIDRRSLYVDCDVGVLYHFVVHLKLSYESTDNPFTKIYGAVDNGAWSLLLNSSAEGLSDSDYRNAWNSDAAGGEHNNSYGYYQFNTQPAATWGAGDIRIIDFGMHVCSTSTFAENLTTDDLDDIFQVLQVS